MINQNIPRGQLSTILLSTLLTGDKYGYEIINDIKEKTNGELIIKQPSLYSALSRLEKQEFISSYWRDSDIGGRRHYYSLTDLGKKQLEKLEDNFYISQKNVSNCLSVNISSTGQPLLSNNDINLDENKTVIRDKEENCKIDNVNIMNNSNLSNNLISNDKQTSSDLQNLKNEEKTNQENNQIITTDSSIHIEDVFENKTENAIVHQNSFLGMPNTSLKIGQEDSINALNNQINLFDNQENNYIKKPFNIDKELAYVKTENKSFTDGYKNQSKLLNDAVLLKNNKIQPTNSFDNQSNADVENDNKELIYQNIDQFENVLNKNSLINENIVLSDNNLKEHKDDGVFINSPTPNSLKQENLNNESENILFQNEYDNGIFITEKYSPDEFPKVKKINVIHLEDKNNNSIEFDKNQIESGYTEKINELYNKSNQVNEKDFENDVTVDSYEKLQDYYNKINVKFKTYPNELNNHNENIITTSQSSNKMAFKKYLYLFAFVFIETLICYFAFSNFDLIINYSFLYIILPLMFLILPAYHLFLILTKKEEYISEIKLNSFWIDLMLFLVGIVLLYSLNMLLGMTYLNITQYATTFIYPSILLLNIFVNYGLNFIVYKNLKIKR